MTGDYDPDQNPATVQVPPISRKSLKTGLINPGAVSENDRPQTSVMESQNFHFDAIGSAILRKGTTRLGNQLSGNILGMHYFVDNVSPDTNTKMIVVNGTVAYYNAAGTWTSKRTSLTSGSKARFTTFLNFAWMVNGTEATAIWDGVTGNSFITTGNASGAPTGKFIENFITRVWIAGNSTYPDRLYYSSVPSAAATPVVTWSTDPVSGTQWIDISPNDGDVITGLQRFRQWLIIFKTNRIYRLLGIGQVDPDPYYAVGTSSQESVVETKMGVFFHHSSGIYLFNTYGQVQEVSRPVWDIVRSIPSSYYPSIVGWVEADQDHVIWSIGNVTVNSIAYTNLHIRYTISTQAWTHYTYATPAMMSIKRQPFYTDGSSQIALVGDNAGNVLQMNVGVTDNGTPISYSLIHGWDNIDGFLSTRKTVTTANFTHYGGAGTQVTYQTDEQEPDNPNTWNKVGPLGVINTGMNSMAVKGRKIRFRIQGQSVGQPFTYNGYELLDITSEFIQFT